MQGQTRGRISVIEGDITVQLVDAIVNAAGPALLGGGGVDGSIHRAAGPALIEECRKLGGCRPGEAKITKGYRLVSRFVIHTVGPVWKGGRTGEDRLLETCYRNSLELALLSGVRSIAFPAISTGAYGFPYGRATRIAVRTVRDFISVHPDIDTVLFVCYGGEAYRTYCESLDRDMTEHPETALAEALTGHLLMIETTHDIHFRNREEIVRRIVPATKNNIQILSAGMMLNNWVAESGVNGEVTVPGGILLHVVERLKGT